MITQSQFHSIQWLWWLNYIRFRDFWFRRRCIQNVSHTFYICACTFAFFFFRCEVFFFITMPFFFIVLFFCVELKIDKNYVLLQTDMIHMIFFSYFNFPTGPINYSFCILYINKSIQNINHDLFQFHIYKIVIRFPVRICIHFCFVSFWFVCCVCVCICVLSVWKLKEKYLLMLLLQLRKYAVTLSHLVFFTFIFHIYRLL